MDHEETSKDNPQEKGSGASPTAAQEEKAQPEYQIEIFGDWCKSCGICAAFCPRQCLGLDSEGVPVVVDSSRCTGCRWCELHCPDFAICIRELISGKAAAGQED
jgi:2-oxoglutarate ferredoxin oxidoreductase subunit delta